MTNRFSLCVALALALSTMPARHTGASFEAAVQAFDAGDYGAAAAYWRALAEACDPAAQTALAGLYHGGLGVPRDPRTATGWYLSAAESGERFAQQIVGAAYAEGAGVTADPFRAAFWLTLAARQGLGWSADYRDAIIAKLTDAERARLAAAVAGFRPTRQGHCEPRR